MEMIMSRSTTGRAFLAALLLAAGTLLGMAAPARAVDTPTTRDAPDLTAVRAKVKAKEWKAAISDLNGMIEKGVQHADVYNLLGFSLRKSGDLNTAYTYYRKALEFDPNHKGALEYLGELYVERGDLAKAREHVVLLRGLCPQGCEELEDLEKAIAQAGNQAGSAPKTN
jgi:Flp pilus assembly protein TadD